MMSSVALLQPLCSTTNSSGFTKEWTNATWRDTWGPGGGIFSCPSYLVPHRLLSVLPLPAPVEEGDEEEGAPEDEVGHLYHIWLFQTGHLVRMVGDRRRMPP